MAVTGALVVANADAGSTERAEVDGAVARLAAGAATELRWTDDADALDDAIAALDGRVLVVAGGDGSIHLAVQRLAALGALEEATVGLVPLGTGNDLARTLGTVDRPPGEGILEGHERAIDLLRDDEGTLVVNMAHLGLGVPASRRAGGLKRTLGPLAYPVGAVVAAARSGPWDLTVRVDDEVLHEGAAIAVAVANGQTAGGGTRFAPGADPSDGVAEVVVFPHGSLAARGATAVALQRGRHLERSDVPRARGRQVVIEGAAAANVDGELEDARDRHRYEVLPGALRLLLPGPSS